MFALGRALLVAAAVAAAWGCARDRKTGALPASVPQRSASYAGADLAPDGGEDPFAHSAHLARVRDGADMVLEVEGGGGRNVVLRKPTPEISAPPSDISVLVATTRTGGRRLAVVLVPYLSMIDAKSESVDEIAAELNDQLRQAGFANVLFFTPAHGLLVEAYPNGVPSREEARRRKKVILSHPFPP